MSMCHSCKLFKHIFGQKIIKWVFQLANITIAPNLSPPTGGTNPNVFNILYCVRIMLTELTHLTGAVCFLGCEQK